MIRILTKNLIENKNIDGARANHFNAGQLSGIVAGALNSGAVTQFSSNILQLDTCELRISGHRIVIDEAQQFTIADTPVTPVAYALVAELVASEADVVLTFKIQTAATALVQENLHTTGYGTYELQIATFDATATGIENVAGTAKQLKAGTVEEAPEDTKRYIRKDGDWEELVGTGTEASQVSYNNTVSGLIANDVQEAIDEIMAGDVLNKLDYKQYASGTDLNTLEEPQLASCEAWSVASRPSGTVTGQATVLVTKAGGITRQLYIGNGDQLVNSIYTRVQTIGWQTWQSIEVPSVAVLNESILTEIADKTNQKEVNEHFATSGTFDYLAVRTYATNEIVKYLGTFYKSLQDTNLGNTPDTATTYWEAIGGGEAPSEYWIDYAVQPSGSGTALDPYLLETEENWAWMAKETRDFTGTFLFSNVYFYLSKSVYDFSGKIWNYGIGKSANGYLGIFLTSHLSKVQIKGLHIQANNDSDVNLGFFGKIAAGVNIFAEFTEWEIDGVLFADKLTSTQIVNVGIFCAEYGISSNKASNNPTKVTTRGNVFVNGNIKAGGMFGYLRPYFYNRITTYINYVNVYASGTADTGAMASQISLSSGTGNGTLINYGNVYITKPTNYAGAMFGAITSSGAANYLLNYGNLEVQSPSVAYKRFGALAGDASSRTIENAVNFGNVTVKNNTVDLYTGGMTSLSATLKNSVNFGNVYLENNTYGGAIGGLCALNTSLIENCINLGKVVGNTTGTYLAKGIANSTATITSSYYLENTVNGGNDATGLDRTPSGLARESTFIGWDFTTPIWNLNVNQTGFNVPMLEAFKNLNLKQPEYYTAVYNAWFNYSRKIYNQTDVVTLTNPTAKSIFNGGLGNRIIPANTLRVGDKYTVKVKGTYTATATPTNTLTLKVGGVTICESVATIANATDETFDWNFDFAVNAIGATGEIVGSGIAVTTTGGAAQNSLQGRQVSKVSPAPIIDTTIDNQIEVLYTSASTTINAECILIERVRVA